MTAMVTMSRTVALNHWPKVGRVFHAVAPPRAEAAPLPWWRAKMEGFFSWGPFAGAVAVAVLLSTGAGRRLKKRIVGLRWEGGMGTGSGGWPKDVAI